MDINAICASLKIGTDKLSLQNATVKNEALKAVCKSLEKTRRKFLQPTPSTLRLPGTREQGKASLTALALMKKRWPESSAALKR